MTPEKCPGCGAKLRPDMLACPNCPMSFPEDDGPAGAVNPLKQSRYYQFVFPVLFFGAIGAAIWYLGTGLLRLGEANNQIENGNVLGEKVKPDAASAAPATVGAAFDAAIGEKPAAAPGDAKPSDDDGEMLVVSRVDDNGSSDIPRDAPAAPPPPPPKPVTEWRLRGAVYDLTTLKPLAGCALLFTNEGTDRTVKTRTDSSGRYRAIVPPVDGGYSVSIEKIGYAPNYLDPATEGVRKLGAGRREELARNLSATFTAEPATVASESEKPLITDFYLAPTP
ncbi:MAG TPA: carboxypeptidase regulatory-like domain-containing protein [Elusimicrobiota bacterium]|jgi:hypothetical protein|nr:carboxypeptidase regulatory-like domain-containing protein [Elusimicrobiota bacterium]